MFYNIKTMNWYKVIKYSSVEILANNIYYMLMNSYDQDISLPSYGEIVDPHSIKQAINIAVNRVLKETGQLDLNESQMNIVRRLDPDFLINYNTQNHDYGETNVQENYVRNDQETPEIVEEF
jgi:hypothetical protein